MYVTMYNKNKKEVLLFISYRVM